MKFSVIIPTYNRIIDIEDTLNSLKNQTVDKAEFEVIVIDGGTIGFENLAKKFKNELNFKFLLNQQKGASVQRNIGVKNSEGEFLLFIDDDANAAKNWIESFKEQMHLENFGVLAGKILPFWSKNAKSWHKNSGYINNLYSMLDLGEEIKEIEYGFSCNYLIRKKALEEIGGFDPEHGRVGDERILYGEDVVICQKINKNYKNYYVPKAEVYHKVLDYRLKASWLIKRAFAGGLTKGMQNRKPKRIKKFKMNFADYLLMIPYVLGFFKGKILRK